MYFINFGKCNSCKQKKSVALDKAVGKPMCQDCDTENYSKVANRQKEYWISGGKNAQIFNICGFRFNYDSKSKNTLPIVEF